MPDYIEIALRAVAAYLALLIMARLMGKREISEMTFFDYIVGITIGTIAGTLTIDTRISFAVILPALLIFSGFQMISSYLTLKSPQFRKLLEGEPTVLIEKGKIIKENLEKERINMHELTSKLRQKDAFSLADVEFAILETDGQISVQKTAAKQALTPSAINKPSEPSGLGTIVIEEGQVIADKLKQKGLTKSWLIAKLGEQGIFDIADVMLGQVDDAGTLYVDLYEEQA